MAHFSFWWPSAIRRKKWHAILCIYSIDMSYVQSVSTSTTATTVLGRTMRYANSLCLCNMHKWNGGNKLSWIFDSFSYTTVVDTFVSICCRLVWLVVDRWQPNDILTAISHRHFIYIYIWWRGEWAGRNRWIRTMYECNLRLQIRWTRFIPLTHPHTPFTRTYHIATLTTHSALRRKSTSAIHFNSTSNCIAAVTATAATTETNIQFLRTPRKTTIQGSCTAHPPSDSCIELWFDLLLCYCVILYADTHTRNVIHLDYFWLKLSRIIMYSNVIPASGVCPLRRAVCVRIGNITGNICRFCRPFALFSQSRPYRSI